LFCLARQRRTFSLTECDQLSAAAFRSAFRAILISPGETLTRIADASPKEAGQQADDAGQCLPSTVFIRSGLCLGVKRGAFGAGFSEALAGEGEAVGVVHEPIEDG